MLTEPIFPCSKKDCSHTFCRPLLARWLELSLPIMVYRDSHTMAVDEITAGMSQPLRSTNGEYVVLSFVLEHHWKSLHDYLKRNIADWFYFLPDLLEVMPQMICHLQESTVSSVASLLEISFSDTWVCTRAEGYPNAYYLTKLGWQFMIPYAIAFITDLMGQNLLTFCSF